MTLTAEQQAVRSGGIGGSEIAAVAGLNPYSSPLDVWLSKRGLAEKRETTSNMLRGTHLGPALVTWYEEMTGRVVSHHGAHEQTLVCPTHPLVIATPDGLVHATTRQSRVTAVLEVKSPHWRTAHQWGAHGTDEIPDHYVPQVQWEMAAAQVGAAHIAALLSGDLCVYEMTFDAELFAALLDIAQRFWRDHVLADVAPEPDGSESAREWLLRQHPRATADIIQATAEQAGLLSLLKEARAQREAAEQAEETLRQRLMSAIGSHEGIEAEGVGRISWRNNKPTTKLDKDALIAALKPSDELIAQHTITKDGPRVFRCTFAK